MAKLDLYHYMDDLKNVNEKRVWKMLGEYLDSADVSNICTCSICLIDMAALTLNNIPASYQTEEHMTIAKEAVSDVEIFRQLKKAVELVSKRPHH